MQIRQLFTPILSYYQINVTTVNSPPPTNLITLDSELSLGPSHQHKTKMNVEA